MILILKIASLSLLPSRNCTSPIKSQDVVPISQSCAWDVANWLIFWAPDGNCREEGRQSLCCKSKDMFYTLPSHSFAPWFMSSHSPRYLSPQEKRQSWDPPQSFDILKMLVHVERPRDAWIWHIPDQVLPRMLLSSSCWQLKLLIHMKELPVEIWQKAHLFLKANLLPSKALLGKSRYCWHIGN